MLGLKRIKNVLAIIQLLPLLILVNANVFFVPGIYLRESVRQALCQKRVHCRVTTQRILSPIQRERQSG